MEFCPKCGSVIVLGEKKKASCAKCNYRPKGRVKIEVSQKIAPGGQVAVIKEKDLNTKPIVGIKCPECKYKEAYFWTLQTRAADESETKFYKCIKCEHTWRVYK